MGVVMTRVARLGLALGHTDPPATTAILTSSLRAGLRELGMTPEWIDRFVAGDPDDQITTALHELERRGPDVSA